MDPYLSNSVEKIEPENYRRFPIDNSFLKIKPDIILQTHEHLDHTDPATLVHYIDQNSGVLVLAPTNAWKKIRKFFRLATIISLCLTEEQYGQKRI